MKVRKENKCDKCLVKLLALEAKERGKKERLDVDRKIFTLTAKF